VSAVCFSAKAIFAKLAYRHGADPTTVLGLRMAFALPFFALAALRPHAPRLTKRELLHLFVLGSVGYYLASLFDFLGLSYVSAGLERLILFLYPTIVIAFNALFYRERVGARLWQAVALGYTGVGLVVWSDRMIGGSDVALGSALVFMGAITYAFYLSGSQPLIMRHGSTRVTSYALVVACSCAIVQFLTTRGFSPLPSEVLWLAAATGVVATVIPAFLLTAGIQRLGASRASLIGTVGPVSTLLLAYQFLDEPVTWLQIAGSALVLLGVFRVSQPARSIDERS
jgi:drug/metabolite transporter (DMT)-like permease